VGVEGAFSNVVTMAIGTAGQECESPLDMVDDFIGQGSRFGALVLARAKAKLQVEKGKPPMDLSLDIGLAAFGDLRVQGGLQNVIDGFGGLQGISLPPVGSCQAYTGNLDLENLLGGIDLEDPVGSVDPDVGDDVQTKALDAGAVLSLSGPGGDRELATVDEESSGLYVGLLGGGIPFDETPVPPLFLMRGVHTLSGPGGVDIPRFSTNFNVPDLPDWSNRESLDTIDRSRGFTMQWTGGDPSQVVVIGGVSTNQVTQATGGFFCVANAADGSFRIRPADVANMPVSGGAVSLDDSMAIVGMVAIPASSLTTLTIPTLDTALVFTTTANIRTVLVQ